MTELEAVTIALQAVGNDPPTTLSGTLDNEVVAARRILATELRRILSDGWPCNIVHGLEVPFPAHTIAASGGSGTFTYGQTVTESVSLAVFTFDHESDGKMHMHLVSGTPTGGQTLTGTGGGAPTRTGAAYAVVTENAIAADPDWLSIRSQEGGPQVTIVDGFIQQLSETDPSTTTFDNTLVVTVHTAVAIDALSPALADYVASQAGYELQRFLKRANPDDSYAQQSRLITRAKALRERRQQAQRSVTESPVAYRFKGNRVRRF